MEDNIPKGGRGKKAPYDTVVVRVPKPCLDAVWGIMDTYRETGEVPTIDNKIIGAIEAWDKARLIYESRIGRTKSAKASMEKLLQVVYGVEVEL